jgi:hypothetical protein
MVVLQYLIIDCHMTKPHKLTQHLLQVSKNLNTLQLVCSMDQLISLRLKPKMDLATASTVKK